MKRTVSASLWTMMSLPSCARYPSGGTPPIHIPFFFEAAILSRMRSPMTLSLADRDRRADHRGTLVGSPVLWRQQASACILGPRRMKKPATETRRNGSLRCAIYTPKSSEEGLDQEFNSLQTQREACKSFIDNQRPED